MTELRVDAIDSLTSSKARESGYVKAFLTEIRRAFCVSVGIL